MLWPKVFIRAFAGTARKDGILLNSFIRDKACRYCLVIIFDKSDILVEA